ncbi:hypothetical protein GS511_08505 [Leptospira borgpetersenii]|nr:hypothetical protein B1H38_06945 [Leptospira borgpetersenii serovar Ballum]QHE27022.1 hypothetical protein GS524_08500 [Leptospira borgpetersenii]QHE30322.1 hypothetical protein GS523_08510 [Leptospira borgpetersenii]QHE33627.1 hypothetical protein GS517_08505 [Leptospira borgpetersenii]QHE36861.1 hypothetical protein GS510_08155 [Leptospira borgpetersenii]
MIIYGLSNRFYYSRTLVGVLTIPRFWDSSKQREFDITNAKAIIMLRSIESGTLESVLKCRNNRSNP